MLGLALQLGIGLGPGGTLFPLSGLNFWVRSDVGVTTSGSNVTGWADVLSGGGLVMTHAGASNTTYAASGGLNNLPKLTLPSSSNKLTCGTSLVSAKSDRTLIVMMQPSGSITSPGDLFTYRQSAPSVCVRYDASAGMVSDESSFNDNGGYTPNTSAHALMFQTSNSGHYVYQLGGVSGGTPSLNTSLETGSAGFILGQGAAGNGHWTGDVYEILHWTRALSVSEIAQVNAYLMNRYGVI